MSPNLILYNHNEWHKMNSSGQFCVTWSMLPRYSSQQVLGLLPKVTRLKCSTHPMKGFHTQNCIPAAPEWMLDAQRGSESNTWHLTSQPTVPHTKHPGDVGPHIVHRAYGTRTRLRVIFTLCPTLQSYSNLSLWKQVSIAKRSRAK